MGVGRNLSYKKSMFLDNKGFGEHMEIIGGDDDLFVNQHATSKKTKVQIGPESNTVSIPKANLSEYFRQKLRHLSVGKHYRFKTRFVLGLLMISQLLIWPLFIGLLIQNPELYVLIAGFLVRTLMMHITFIFACRKLGIKFETWSLLFLDGVLTIYYMVTGLSALLTKRVRWN